MIKNKILSTVLAAAVGISAAPAYAPAAFAAAEVLEYTFDNQYPLKATISEYGLLDIESHYDDFDYEIVDLKNNLSRFEKTQAALKTKLKSIFKKDPERVTFEDLNKITSLDLSNLGLRDVPEFINYMENLRSINLSNNFLFSEDISKLKMSVCSNTLATVNLSNNYLDTVPVWARTEKVTSRNLKNNFILSDEPREIKVGDAVSTFYFEDGDDFDEMAFKKRILDAVYFSGDTKKTRLSSMLYDPYALNDDEYIASGRLNVDLTALRSYIKADGSGTNNKIVFKENASKIVTISAELFSSNAEIRIYLLNKNDDLSTIKIRLDLLIRDYATRKKDEYTETSWNNYEIAKKTAEAIYSYENADAQMLRSAFDTLNGAKNALIESANGNKNIADTLKALVSIGKDYKEANYTPASWTRFKTAYDTITVLSKDKNASAAEAQRAIKEFQTAQNALTGAQLSVPAKAAKSDFEKIYGDDKSISFSGTTGDGYRYTWTFNGKDITAPKEFNPEIKDTDNSEENIRIEAGSASNYRLFATAQTGELPGKATLNLDVSDKFGNGNYYLYKWDNSAKRSTLEEAVTVKDGRTDVHLTTGGVYYLSPTLGNFDLVSEKFTVDTQNHTVKLPLAKSYRAKNFRSEFQYGTSTVLLDKDGNAVPDSAIVVTGMTVNAPNREKYSVIFTGDADGNGSVTAGDASAILKSIVSENKNESITLCGDINGDGAVNAKDASLILKFCAGM